MSKTMLSFWDLLRWKPNLSGRDNLASEGEVVSEIMVFVVPGEKPPAMASIIEPKNERPWLGGGKV